MSNNYWEDEDDDLDMDSAPTSDSDLLKKLRKAKRADEKRIKELTEQLETYTKQQRERTVKEILEKKGVNQKAARLIMNDLSEVNEESVNSWLDDNADLFGLQTRTDTGEQAPDLAALRQQDVVTQNAYTPDRSQDIEQRLNSIQDADELIAMLRSME